jgi:hypothetical protein
MLQPLLLPTLLRRPRCLQPTRAGGPPTGEASLLARDRGCRARTTPPVRRSSPPRTPLPLRLLRRGTLALLPRPDPRRRRRPECGIRAETRGRRPRRSCCEREASSGMVEGDSSSCRRGTVLLAVLCATFKFALAIVSGERVLTIVRPHGHHIQPASLLLTSSSRSVVSSSSLPRPLCCVWLARAIRSRAFSARESERARGQHPHTSRPGTVSAKTSSSIRGPHCTRCSLRSTPPVCTYVRGPPVDLPTASCCEIRSARGSGRGREAAVDGCAHPTGTPQLA